MCIRDRIYPTLGYRILHTSSLQGGLVELHEALRERTSVFVCLLYTSDAADERSSVDLGGRRIIKKKTRDDSGSIHNHI